MTTYRIVLMSLAVGAVLASILALLPPASPHEVANVFILVAFMLITAFFMTIPLSK